MPSLNLRIPISEETHNGVVLPLRQENRLTDVIRTMLDMYYLNDEFRTFVDSGGSELASNTMDEVLNNLNELNDFINGSDILLGDLSDDVTTGMENLTQGTALDDSEELDLDDILGSSDEETQGVTVDRLSSLEETVSGLASQVSTLVEALMAGNIIVAGGGYEHGLEPKPKQEVAKSTPTPAPAPAPEPVVPVMSTAEVTFDEEFGDDEFEDDEAEEPSGLGNLISGAFGSIG